MRFPPNWLQALVITSHPLSLSERGYSGRRKGSNLPQSHSNLPALTLWDVRGLFKIKLVTTQLFVVLSRQSLESTFCLL